MLPDAVEADIFVVSVESWEQRFGSPLVQPLSIKPIYTPGLPQWLGRVFVMLLATIKPIEMEGEAWTQEPSLPNWKLNATDSIRPSRHCEGARAAGSGHRPEVPTAGNAT